MNRKLLAATLPLLGGAVIVGAGFGAWAFNDDQTAVDEATGTVDVTPLLEGVTAKVVYSRNSGTETNPNIIWRELETFTLELDQGALFDTNILNGITPLVDVGGSDYEILQIAVQVYYLGTDPTLTDLLQDHNLTIGGFKVGFKDNTSTVTNSDGTTSTVNVAPTITTYADMLPAVYTGFSGITSTTIQSLPLATAPVNLLPESLDGDSDNLLYVTDPVDFNWQYKTGQKPTTNSAYSAMATALEEDPTFTLTFSVSGAWSVKA